MTSSQSENNWQWQEPGAAWKGVGIYHLTLTVPSREPLLGTLFIPDNDPQQASIQRTELGEQLVETLLAHPTFFPEIRILQFCLMPDHLHAILHVTRPMKESINVVVRSFWQGAKKLGRAYSASLSTPSLSISSASHAAPCLSLSISPESHSGHPVSLSITPASHAAPCPSLSITPASHAGTLDPIFTERPFIRPLSRRGQLQSMFTYIKHNPQRLATKRLMPGFFRVQEGIDIAGRSYSGVGNIRLLHNKCFAPVHVRSMWVKDAEQHGNAQPLRDYMNGCILSARQGTIMVSPFISPKEKEVLSVLLAEKLPFILLSDNGFRDYYKPSDALFDAVAEGRVLILSPWEHDPDKLHISREDCVALNGMAEEICTLSHS